MATYISNKKTRLDYEILDTFEAGIELLGLEVKSVRAGQGSLLGAHISVRGGEAYLLGAHIPAFQEQNAPLGFDPDRNRRLLLTKKEIATLAGLEGNSGRGKGGKGLTIIPISMYNKGRKIKVEIALARGKKQFDKRQTLKKRQSVRDVERGLRD